MPIAIGKDQIRENKPYDKWGLRNAQRRRQDLAETCGRLCCCATTGCLWFMLITQWRILRNTNRDVRNVMTILSIVGHKKSSISWLPLHQVPPLAMAVAHQLSRMETLSIEFVTNYVRTIQKRMLLDRWNLLLQANLFRVSYDPKRQLKLPHDYAYSNGKRIRLSNCGLVGRSARRGQDKNQTRTICGLGYQSKESSLCENAGQSTVEEKSWGSGFSNLSMISRMILLVRTRIDAVLER